MHQMDQWVEATLHFIAHHGAWAGPIVFALAFAESIAFVSLLVPFTAAIISAGALVGAGTLDPWIIVPWGIAGAAAGDAVSYWIGRYFEERVPRLWPFRNHPEMLARGRRFFARWGVLSVFIGRFFGPLRAAVPIVAGMMRMTQWKFQLANVVSAIVWLPALLLPGAIAGHVLRNVAHVGETVFGYVFVFFIVASIVVALVAWLRTRRRTRSGGDGLGR